MCSMRRSSSVAERAGGRRVTFYFGDEPVEAVGACDDGWVWASYQDRKGKLKHAWFWMMQLHPTPWGA
jgi:hypothetical protein